MAVYSFKRITLVCLMLVAAHVSAQQPAATPPATPPAKKPDPTVVAGIPVNYDENNVGTYTLPDVLTLANGQKVTDAKTWKEKRRPEILAMFESEQFGKAPAKPKLRFNVFDKGTPAYGGKAIRKQVTIYFDADTSNYKVELLVYLPANAAKPAPVFLEANFSTNAGAVSDTGIKPAMIWTKDGKREPAPAGRGGFGGKLAVEKFIDAGFGIATFCYSDLDPDVLNAATWGIRGKYLKAGETKPAPNEWGAIACWAWEISSIMDYFVTDKQVDAKRVAIHGTSRLGKTVLWAGATDPRIALVISSCSGEGGAALSRRNFGETTAHMIAATRYDYQFAINRQKYGPDPGTSPVDAHMLVALMAPRPVLLQTGDTDNWSDPKGEYLSALAAEPVFKLFGKSGPTITDMPAPSDKRELMHTLGYYMHSGGHGTVPGDWDIFIEYLKNYL